MSGLLKAANIQRVDVVRNEGFDAVGCALSSEVSNICTPITRVSLTGTPDGDGQGPDTNIFHVITRMKSRARCSPGSEESFVSAALDFEAEKAAGVALWGGTGDNPDVSLMGPDVATVVAGASTNATVAALLQEFWGRATGVAYEDTILHLGVARLLEMFAEIEGGLLKNLDIKVATSPGYPSDGVAVSGPILIKLGPDETLQGFDSATNDIYTEASRLGGLEFDPCFAVRVQ